MRSRFPARQNVSEWDFRCLAQFSDEISTLHFSQNFVGLLGNLGGPDLPDLIV